MSLRKSPFGNSKLENNNIEEIGWKKFSVAKRLESALLWGKEIECLHKKLYGNKILLKKIKRDLKHSK